MVKLEISLKRVQTFIFEVPRLKAMLGANALIGQTMRHELPKLMNGMGYKLRWPPSLSSPATTANDPLLKTADPDDPGALYDKGILARDGGHFIAVFADEPAAAEFRRQAEEKLADLLPGVLFDAEIKPFPEPEPTNDVAPDERRNHEPSETREIHLFDLPVLQVCQETGQEPASYGFKGDDGRKRWRARSVTHRLGWGRRFQSGSTQDIIGLLRQQLYPAHMGRRPNDVAQLAAGGYLALIHADGNGIGKRYKKKWKDQTTTDDPVDKEARGEAFFHSMRVAVRRAIVDALANTFTDSYATRPYEVLMLGGDDLLLICRADKALEFARSYASELKEYPLADGQPLDVAIGVAIAQKSYPLHRLQELAESLASSAKRLYRSLDGNEQTSVIDWQVVTQSWFEGVAEARQQSERVMYSVGGKPETLLLSGRPYRILGNDGLEGLLAAVRELDGQGVEKAARSPLRSLRGACEQGRLAAEMAFSGLTNGVCSTLAWEDGKLWKRIDIDKGDAPFYLTRALDVIGIREITRLGRKKND